MRVDDDTSPIDKPTGCDSGEETIEARQTLEVNVVCLFNV